MAIKISGTTVIDDSRNLVSVGVATVGSGNSAVILNGDSGITNIGSGVTINGNTGDINISGILTVGQLSVPISVSSFDPADGSSDGNKDQNIIITFNQTVGLGTTGFIELKQGSTTGTLIQTFYPSSSGIALTSGGTKLSINPTSSLPTAAVHPIMSVGFVVANGSNFTGINTVGSGVSYSFTIPVSLGDSYEGGFLICKASPLRWVVSPYSAEVSRTWYLRDDANTRAQQVSGCTGWFVPTISQLQNPGFICRSFWGPSPCFSSTRYWSSTEFNATSASTVRFTDGCVFNFYYKTVTSCVRAFRCVTY